MTPSPGSWMALVAGLLLPLAGQADGLRASEGAHSAWQARLMVGRSLDRDASPVASLTGEYYFGAANLRPGIAPSGLRASSGVVFGAGTAALGVAAFSSLGPSVAPDVAAPLLRARQAEWPDGAGPVPYVGLGYSLGEPGGSGWGLSADVGLAGSPIAAGLSAGRAAFGQSRLDDAVRSLKWRPVLQVGLRFSY